MPAAFTVREFLDLVTALERHPEWRQELRRLLLTDDVLTLPRVVRELAEAQKRTEAIVAELVEAHRQAEKRLAGVEERLTRLEATVAELAEAHRQAEKRLAAAEERLSRVEERLAGVEERLAGVEERLTRLEAVVAELAEAHRQAEKRLAAAEERLTGVEERLTRLEAVVAELAEAQKRSEERLTRLEATVAELAEAQKRTEEYLKELAGAQARVETRLSRLESIIGVTVEEEAADVLRVVLERKGYRVRGGPIWWRPDGEVDVILPVEDPEGRYIHVVLEAKARLGWRAVEAWAHRMRSEGFRARLAEDGFAGPYLIYVYGMRADTSAEQAAQNLGIGLLVPRGEVIPPKGPE
ncbi:MAG: hypothetical protein H5T61_04620 [Thermoflexales bacterium]|nr:hypothetical protein [Thermoflexales bacterium]